MLGLRHRHLLYLPPNGMETLRAKGVENLMPQLELAVVGSPQPWCAGGWPGPPGRSRVSPGHQCRAALRVFLQGPTPALRGGPEAPRGQRPLTGSSGPQAPLLPPEDIWRAPQWRRDLPPVCPAMCVCMCRGASPVVPGPCHALTHMCVCMCVSVGAHLPA